MLQSDYILKMMLHSDAKLTNGNLPRDDVEDSLERVRNPE